jgi:hypothetical protein
LAISGQGQVANALAFEAEQLQKQKLAVTNPAAQASSERIAIH